MRGLMVGVGTTATCLAVQFLFGRWVGFTFALALMALCVGFMWGAGFQKRKQAEDHD